MSVPAVTMQSVYKLSQSLLLFYTKGEENMGALLMSFAGQESTPRIPRICPQNSFP